MKPGDRVGAILSMDKEGLVRFLGYGTYEGEFVPPNTGNTSMTRFLSQLEFPNPKILLDNGDVVWGCECWWGSEAEIREQMSRSTRVEEVRIADFRGTE